MAKSDRRTVPTGQADFYLTAAEWEALVSGGAGFTGFSDTGSIVSLTTGRQLGIGSTADPDDTGGSRMWIEDFGSATRSSQLYVFAADTGRTASDSSSVYINNQAFVDTTAGDVQCVGLRIICDPSKHAGSNALNNVGLLIDTNAGDTNQAIWVSHGTCKFDEDVLTGPLTTVGNVSLSGGSMAITGTAGSSITFTGSGGNIVTGGQVQCTGQIVTGGNVRLAGNTLWFTDSSASELYFYADSAGTSGNQNVNIMAGGTGVVRVNSNTAGTTNTGTGGFEVWAGNNSTTKWLDIDSGGFRTANINHGFYGATAVAKQTGVAVTASAIHTALVNLGLIGA